MLIVDTMELLIEDFRNREKERGESWRRNRGEEC